MKKSPVKQFAKLDLLLREAAAKTQMACGATAIADIAMRSLCGLRGQFPPSNWTGEIMRFSMPNDGTIYVLPDPGQDPAPWRADERGEVRITIFCGMRLLP